MPSEHIQLDLDPVRRELSVQVESPVERESSTYQRSERQLSRVI